ncbi:hypothetical protein [Kribbella sindirgiensis]|uniref:TrbL/VirB6 plasmid conjugal transfer protein n=1 Tax=Kribbella sindirgiensis TaxID=1124744 RepID=A0A4R0IPN2_9ACTN|nr:hypothetical protein [Kribbella sindirgiensis]TCC34949.1 hypothetical protein E0H50_13745 [Kribbella sindirgiensis]
MPWKDCLLNPADCARDAVDGTAWNIVANWMAKGLSDMAINVFDKFSASTTPDFNQTWWRDNLDMIVTISLPLLVIAFVLQCAAAAIRREPARLGSALFGALLGTAGVPFAIAVVVASGHMVDQIASTILGHNPATIQGFRRIVDITRVLGHATNGGFLIMAIEFAILATMALYFVMLVREVALVAFVVLAPIALASWTWNATRHWLRRWIEVVGALLFSKIIMAVIFTMGLSAIGNTDQAGDSSLGTFLAGSLLLAMAAFAPLATYSFIHWAGDQGQSALYAVQQGTAGASAIKDRLEQAQRWAAFDFTGSRGQSGPGPVVGGDSESGDETASGNDPSTQGQPGSDIGPDSSPATAPADVAGTTQASVDRSVGPGADHEPGSHGDSDGQGGETR